MSGTRDRVEGNVELIAESTYSSGSTPLNSLEGIDISSLQDGATCFVRTGALSFRWFQDDTSAPSATVILPSQLTVSDPGRWIEITGGGGGGGVTSLIGTNGIAIINPVGPAVTVNGIALYARDGSNGAMLANMSMGGFGITNATGLSGTGNLVVTSSGGNVLVSSAVGRVDLTAPTVGITGSTAVEINGGTDTLIWPAADGTAGQAIITDGAGNLSFGSVSATPAAPNKSVQYNNAGAFGGSPTFTFETAAAGVGPQLFLDSTGTTDVGTGYVIKSSLGATVGTFTFSEDPILANYFTTLSGAGLLQIDAFNGALELKSTTNLTLTRGAVSWQWPAADGTAGQALVTDGAGNLSFASASASPAAPDRSIQFNNAGVFDGSAQLTFQASATERTVRIASNSAGTTFAGILLRNSSAANVGSLHYNEVANDVVLRSLVTLDLLSDGTLTLATSDTIAGTASGIDIKPGNATGAGTGGAIVLEGGDTVGGTPGDIVVTAGDDSAAVNPGGNLLLYSGTGSVSGSTRIGAGGVDAIVVDDSTVASLAAGSVLSWNGTQNVYVTPGSLTNPTIQNIAAAGPTNVTDSAYTVALVNFAGAAAVVLPAPTSGKRMTVKDRSGNAATNNITVTSASGSLDGAASQTIATNYGSMTFVGDGTNWWVI